MYPSQPKHRLIISMTFACSSFVILLSLGRHNPLVNISAPTSSTPPAIYALVFARTSPERVINGFIRHMGCICIGFHIGRPSALMELIASRISVGQLFPCSGTYIACASSRTCLHIASLSIIMVDSQ